MPPQRDLFVNFERMRRQMDELFGDAFERGGITPRRRAGFTPAVDVHYVEDPPRVVVRAELAGVDPGSLALEIQGNELVIAGNRRPLADEGGVYQQVEIEHGPFKRAVGLGADVLADESRAQYEDGMLRVELPIAAPASRPRALPATTERQAVGEAQ